MPNLKFDPDRGSGLRSLSIMTFVSTLVWLKLQLVTMISMGTSALVSLVSNDAFVEIFYSMSEGLIMIDTDGKIVVSGATGGVGAPSIQEWSSKRECLWGAIHAME